MIDTNGGGGKIPVRLWIGGTSGLARTYFNYYVFKTTMNNNNNNKNKNKEEDSIIPWLIIGRSVQPPDWLQKELSNNNNNNKLIIKYISWDLTKTTDDDNSRKKEILQHIRNNFCIISIVLSIRPQLVTYRTNQQSWDYNTKLLYGLSDLLRMILTIETTPTTTSSTNDSNRGERPTNTSSGSQLPQQQQQHHEVLIVHISSIAAVDHIKKQSMYSLRRNQDPESKHLQYPYDRFKRQSEELIIDLCNRVNNNTEHDSSIKLTYTNIRMGAIFSDTTKCIQCNALGLQMYTGPYLPLPIDCNSSLNISHLIHLILIRYSSSSIPSQKKHHDENWILVDKQPNNLDHHPPPLLRPIYFYTRPMKLLYNPRPYGEYLLDYRRAYNITFPPIVLPHWLLEILVVKPFHYITIVLVPLLLCCTIPYLESIDYLLQVTTAEHTFDMTETQEDFPELESIEETIYECFTRRRRILEK